ncbi:hypothetical protein LCGC14_0687550 [marine sediment metagenome]|uniref:Uncharacterized protein n=1 Tax=marine sediment metagenome TaxID=412755 RepID=A0A0F9QR96_9ZZZZ
MTNELTTLRKEVEKLKLQKKNKMALATTTQERDKLLKEISQLEAIKKSPSALKKFGRTYLRGLKKTGSVLWRGITKVSRNLEANAPEFRQMSKGMMGQPKRPTSPMMEMYVPKASPYYSTTPRKMKSVKSRPLKRKMKSPKLKKRKQVKRMKRKSYSNRPSKPKSQMAWDIP